MSARVTACLIVQDEQEHLPAALASLSFCDEIVLVDGGSTDRTVEIARSAGAKVIENPWPGFAAQRNLALDNATGDWVLEVDADERVSPLLRTSIEKLVEMPEPDAKIAVCALRNRFLGGLLGPSAKYPAYRSRLFRRGAYRHDESRQVHEGIEPRERPIVLEGDLEHELASTLSEAVRDAWRYARLESGHLLRPSGVHAYVIGITLRPIAKIAYRVLIDGGWRDGWRGLLKIWLDAASDALVWALVLLRRRGPTTAEKPVASVALQSHFGRRPAGQPKVVAIAGRGRSAQTARTWLARLSASGVDTTLVSNDAHLDTDVPMRISVRMSPLTTMRALDIEMELRTIQSVVPFGRRAKLVHRILPRTFRPSIEGVSADVHPDAAVQAIRAAYGSTAAHSAPPEA